MASDPHGTHVAIAAKHVENIDKSDCVATILFAACLLAVPIAPSIRHELDIVLAAAQIIHVIIDLSVFLGSLGVTAGYAVR